jgi:DNA-binding NarL/FixJ family response regulator
MAKGRQSSDDTRASVMAALLAGQAVCEVAKQLKVSEATVSMTVVPKDQANDT